MVMSLAACNASKDNAEKNKSEQAEIVSGISVGMTSAEVREGLKSRNIEYFEYSPCFFFEDEEGMNVVVRTSVSADSLVKEVKRFKKTIGNSDDFGQIKEGMTIFEVVEFVGIPIESTTSGMSSVDFLSSDGSRYRVYVDALTCNVTSEPMKLK